MDFFYFIEINYLDEFIFQIYHSRSLSYAAQSLANDSMPYKVDDSNYIYIYIYLFIYLFIFIFFQKN